MSRNQYIKMLERELNKVNKIIDLKILQGRNYLIESHRHRFLLRKLRDMKNRTSFADRLFSFF